MPHLTKALGDVHEQNPDAKEQDEELVKKSDKQKDDLRKIPEPDAKLIKHDWFWPRVGGFLQPNGESGIRRVVADLSWLMSCPRACRRRCRRDGYLQLWNCQRTLPQERLVLDPDSMGKYRLGYGSDHGRGSES